MYKCTFVHCNFKITLKWEVSSRPHVYIFFCNYMICMYLMRFKVMSYNFYSQPGRSLSCEQFVLRIFVVYLVQ